jgi:hypothetical protein
MLPSDLRLGVPSYHFPSCFPTKVLQAFMLASHACYTHRPSRPPWFDHANNNAFSTTWFSCEESCISVSCRKCDTCTRVLRASDVLSVTSSFTCLLVLRLCNLQEHLILSNVAQVRRLCLWGYGCLFYCVQLVRCRTASSKQNIVRNDWVIAYY